MRLTHVFVESFPEPLEEGRLYVSMQYASVAHLCPCGCGSEVVTPLGKRAWRLTFDGESITLSPSVGSHNLNCRSHYFIRGNEIRWAGQLSQRDIELGRIANRQGGLDFESPHDVREEPLAAPTVENNEETVRTTRPESGWIERVRNWWRNR